MSAAYVPDGAWLARTISTNLGLHKVSWYIQFNSAEKSRYEVAQWTRIGQHKLGHVFGLADLKNSINRARLMWWQGGQYQGLTLNEKYGLANIWGY
ncbi:hypothetical protein CSV63_10155 [Sporosarcina sp. P34]|nr:hypothetical protein CSV63_10155 [Sporosarcina sp. P34]PID24849.1 hypothetical protein CSV60_08050 [Sporosarcina sp. P7]